MNKSDLVNRTINLILDQQIKRTFFQGRRFIVTGGAGFLGSWLSEALCRIGSEVFCIDDFSTAVPDNIRYLQKNKHFHLIKTNVISVDLSEIECDSILHLASRPSPDDYQQYPVETLLPNSTGSYKLLEYCREKEVPIAFASTSEVYGDAQLIPTPESYWGYVNPVGLRSCYDEGKRYAEAMYMAYAREYSVRVQIFRIFNTYGPRLRSDGTYGRALSRFISQASAGKDITIYGNGTQTRSFSYVTDTVRAIMYYIQSDVFNDVINIGNPNEITIRKLAEMIIDILGSKSRLQFLPPAPDDPKRRCPDISKANKLLNWHPTVDLETGIKRTVEWNHAE